VVRFFNENNVGNRKTWADENVRKLYRRERLVGIEVFRKSRQIRDRRTGKIRTEKIKPENWLRRESPHLRILTDELTDELADAVKRRLDRGTSSFGRAATDEAKRKRRADVYPRVLIRPVCGGCGEPMCLGRSAARGSSRNPSVSVWEYLMRDGWIIPERPGWTTPARPEIVVSLEYERRAAAR
jgi:hypothetical protein